MTPSRAGRRFGAMAWGPLWRWILRSRRLGVFPAGLVLLACANMVESPSRDTETSGYADQVERVPSFWLDGGGGDLVIPFYVRDDAFPDGADGDALRDITRAALDVWIAPLEANDRPVRVQLQFASSALPEPTRRVRVSYVNRGDNWLGVTRYDGDEVDVLISLHAVEIDRVLTRRELLALTIHEFGHALGISQPGHSLDPNDVMFGHNLDNDWVTLSDGDRATILALYPSP